MSVDKPADTVCLGDNSPYVDCYFAISTSGSAFSCTAPKNTSPNSTGLTDLPRPSPAWIPRHGLTKPGKSASGQQAA